MANQSDDREQAEVLEQGNIYFMYRPKVQEDEAEDFDDVERFYFALKPDRNKRYRLLVVGRKRLPDVGEHERTWGFVEMVTEDPRKLEQGLREETYRTKTRGERVRPAARPAGEGVYTIANVDGKMHLIYALELPRKPDEVQKALKIAPEASFALSVKNPDKSSPKSAGLPEDDQADYPKKQQEKFRDRRFDYEHPELLDYEGAEVVLVGARINPEEEYAVDLDPEKENANTADILKDLRMARSRHPIEPLIRGEWR